MIYELGFSTASGTNNTCAVELYTKSTDRVAILEIEWFGLSNTRVTWGLGRPAAVGLQPVAIGPVLAVDPLAPTGTLRAAVSWSSTAPTAPSTYLRRVTTQATIGSGGIMVFPRGLIVPVSSSLVLFNLDTNALCNVRILVDE